MESRIDRRRLGGGEGHLLQAVLLISGALRTIYHVFLSYRRSQFCYVLSLTLHCNSTGRSWLCIRPGDALNQGFAVTIKYRPCIAHKSTSSVTPDIDLFDGTVGE